MDDETKSFLVSAETVFRFAGEKLANDFDYSLCGCGLWKSVERELNSSLIWYLRRVRNIADNNRKPIADINPSARVDYEAGNATINLNERQRGSIEFEGKMLGNIEWLIRTAQDNNVGREIKPVFQNDQQILDFILRLDEHGLAYLIKQVR
ncbi:hypothetical protein XM38_042540 [Halomicronema hongdechloris C2206]|uniref:Uncharacterized protein n=1 Tax=Halomicronema hongdechloris C2206 TaxID=1641165 RepID=A0A1Z3HSK2_9CYAN|nr:hypothetical protein [Halomicronema hongdechloris]ASC73290.1 hypothetical protein XM38_042540 [Halomicronema hongdechloris C2206]